MQIELRIFTDSDITEDYLSWLSDRSLMRFSQQTLIDHTEQTALKYIRELRESGGELLSIVVKEENYAIGTVSIRKIREHSLDLGIMIGSREHKGKGLGLEAWRQGINHIWENFDVSRITAGTNLKNLSMLRIFEASGMSKYFRKVELGTELIYYYLDRPT